MKIYNKNKKKNIKKKFNKILYINIIINISFIIIKRI